jgi:hypothetical protein
MEIEAAAKELTGSIVHRLYPTETVAFDMAADGMIRDLSVGQDIRKQDRGTAAEFGFATEVQSALTFVGLLWSTYKTLEEVYRNFEPKAPLPHSKDLSTLWMKRLREAGLPDDQAKRIVDGFTQDLASVLTRQRKK